MRTTGAMHTYNILKYFIFPQVSSACYPSPTSRALSTAFLDAFLYTSVNENDAGIPVSHSEH
jgi:hypothetical protein